MTHSDAHNPFIDHSECFTCAEILRRTLNKLAELDIGPKDTDALLRKMREIAAGIA